MNTLQNVVDWIESGAIPRERIQAVQYLDFFAEPEAQLTKLYAGLSMTLTADAKQSMLAYMQAKPQGKFGKHDYDAGEPSLIAEEREKYRAFQTYFGVVSEL